LVAYLLAPKKSSPNSYYCI